MSGAGSSGCAVRAGLIGPYLAGALSHDGQDYGTPLITLGAFVLAAAVMLFGAAQLWPPVGHNGRLPVLPPLNAGVESSESMGESAFVRRPLTGVLQTCNSTNS